MNRVKTSPSLASALASRVLEVVFGSSTSDSFASFDPDSWSLRTSQLSLLEDSTSSSVDLPKAGMMRSGCLFELPTLGRLTGGIGSSSSRGGATWGRDSWATPTASMATPQDMVQAMFAGNDPRRPKYGDAWATPTARDWKSGQVSEATHARNARPLNEQAVKLWPTATATDAKASGAAAYSTASGRHSGTTLTDAAVRVPMWPTPTASDGSGAGHSGQDGLNLRTVASTNGPPDPETPDGPPTSRDTLAELPLFAASSTRRS